MCGTAEPLEYLGVCLHPWEHLGINVAGHGYAGMSQMLADYLERSIGGQERRAAVAQIIQSDAGTLARLTTWEKSQRLMSFP